MKREEGITLIRFLGLILIFIFLITIGIISLDNARQKSNVNKYISEMQLIQEKVNVIRSKYKLWEEYNPNEAGNFNLYLKSLGFTNANSPNNIYMDEFQNIINELSLTTIKNWDPSTDSIITNYFYFTPEDIVELLGIKDIDLYIIVNFNSGNIISKNGIKENGKIIYRQYDSKFGTDLKVSAIYNSAIVPELEIIENRGTSQKIRIALKNKDTKILKGYYYFNDDENKKICNNFKNYSYKQDENAIYFNIDISGKYTFIIEDTNFVQYPKVELDVALCNPPILLENMMGIYWDEFGVEKQIISEFDSNWYNYSKSNLYMANAKTEDGNYWVWIPRYLYKETTEGIDIQFVHGITKIPTNNSVLTGYKTQEAFSNENEFEGIWIAKYQTNFDENEINIKPGKTLHFTEKYNAVNIYQKYSDKTIRKYIDVMGENERESVLDFSKFLGIEISNDLVHYAGGSPDEEEFKQNVKYSNTNNMSGIYDLITSENEITKDSKSEEQGRFRGILKIVR